ncbi:hypothetical protein HYQ44_014528 [Verticillium longisporum]|nr:hypothetical protein HYQ44_014528 [Verticillium longisporum]
MATTAAAAATITTTTTTASLALPMATDTPAPAASAAPPAAAAATDTHLQQQPQQQQQQPQQPPAPVRNFKAADLPLPSATRAAIESLAHSFKKKGGYDAMRKEIWEKFEASDYQAQVTKDILRVAELEVERNPGQLLTLDRGKAAALIDGALERSGVYHKAEAVIARLIDKDAIEDRIRQLRRADIGDDEAAAEQARGARTDDEYHQDTLDRRAAREQERENLRKLEAAIEEGKRKIAREERKKIEREREKEEAKRKEERDARRAAREKAEAEREKERDERRRKRDEERARDPARHKSRSRSRNRDRRRDRSRSRDRSQERRDREDRERRRQEREEQTKQVRENLSKEQLERLEQDALADLLRESNRNSSKDGTSLRH